ncbi:MAG: N-acetyltransferase [Planctomycetales bacterium]|nr:N-acetyltransferase [Planctomycetales bacterium]NIM07964.1 N-acetyltransferase [Planctomycetales bacterium]NIN07442.1 N-acetyltransferase [Planctomycetales bacterium]NIN76549.1 N-acetyltransferase [Planctomycetales bacterium]NIO33736.1 N-acetyltransferase [Planctomycetales bacterium]
MSVFVHPSSFVDDGAQIGAGTSIWHFCHVAAGARIGHDCSLGQNVYVGDGVVVGNRVKVQNNVSLYTGVQLEDDVFCGPSCVFTNVINPRSQVPRKAEFQQTCVQRGASIGANATIICGATIGRYAFIGAGAVVRHDVPQYALMVGVPARQIGWMTRHGHRLPLHAGAEEMICPQSGWRYAWDRAGNLVCRDWPEEKPLPEITNQA